MGNLLTLVYDVLGYNKQPQIKQDTKLNEKELEIYKKFKPYIYDEDLR